MWGANTSMKPMTLRRLIFNWYATYGLIPVGWVMAVVAYFWLVAAGHDWLNILVIEWFVITMATFLNWMRWKPRKKQ